MVNITGSSVVVDETAISGSIVTHSVTGLLDEWGHWQDGFVDEWGNRIHPDAGLNERGDWTDAQKTLDTVTVFGQQVGTTDVANAGTIGSDNVVNGSQALLSDTANTGTPNVDVIVIGSSANIVATANDGVALEALITQGQQATTTATADTGNTYIEAVVEGRSAEQFHIVHAGVISTVIDVSGATATVVDAPVVGSPTLSISGNTATTTETATSGVILLPGFISVQGGQAMVATIANTGSLGVSQLLVSGSRKLVFEIPRKGLATGGAPIYRIMLDKQIKDRVLSGV